MESFADKAYFIRYEDLVTKPQPVLEALGNWLGIDPAGFRCQMVQPGGSIGIHHEGLHPQELTDVMRVAGPTMKRLEYQF